MKRRTMALPAALGAVALTLAGCGLSGSGTDEGSGSDNGDVAEQIAAVSDDELEGTTITMARFFGDCDDTTVGVTDVAEATTECEAIQILTNKFVADNEWGIEIDRLGGAGWHSYYDGLNAAMASSERPDIAVMHGSNLPDYADRGLLVAVPDAVGIDLDDATQPATDAIELDGTSYGVPFDTHAIVSHLNMDILAEAGLVDADGTYTMPESVEELLADAEAVRSATGKTFIDVALSGDPMGSRLWMSLVWQQGEDFIDAEERTASADSEAGTAALELINELVDGGYTVATNDYDASQQAFLRGEAAIMYNGVWAVNQYSAEAPFDYQVADAPMVFEENATWANSHLWAVPVQDDADPVQYRAAFEFAKFLYEHTGEWAIATGHMASTNAALESEAYLEAPHRTQYLNTATEYGRMQPRLVEWPAIGDLVQERIEATWLSGTEVDEALSQLQTEITARLQ